MAPSSSRSPRAAATASRMCVPVASGGVGRERRLDLRLARREREHDARPRVEREHGERLVLTAGSANARAASSAPSIASPRMLSLASITSTTPNSPAPAADAGRTVEPLDRLAVLAHLDLVRGRARRRSGSVSTNARSGNRAPPSSAQRRASVAAAAALTSAAAAASDRREREQDADGPHRPSPPSELGDVRPRVAEQARRQRDAVLLELVQERRAQAGRAQRARSRRGPTVTSSTLNSKRSCSVITSDSMRCDLGDRGDAARAVLEPLEVDDQVERRRDLLADRPHRQVVAGHQHHRLDARERVARRVRVDRARASRRGPCSSPGACPAPRRRGPRRR